VCTEVNFTVYARTAKGLGIVFFSEGELPNKECWGQGHACSEQCDIQAL